MSRILLVEDDANLASGLQYNLERAGYEVTVIARWGAGLATTEKLEHHTVTRIRQPQPLAWLPAPSLPETGDDPHGRLSGMRRRLRDTFGFAGVPVTIRYRKRSRPNE